MRGASCEVAGRGRRDLHEVVQVDHVLPLALCHLPLHELCVLPLGLLDLKGQGGVVEVELLQVLLLSLDLVGYLGLFVKLPLLVGFDLRLGVGTPLVVGEGDLRIDPLSPGGNVLQRVTCRGREVMNGIENCVEGCGI